MNGSGPPDTNGHPPNASAKDLSLTPMGLNRRELVRIIVQSIDALGYPDSARSLERETGIEAMSPQMRTLRDCVLRGHWDQLESVLDSLTVFKSDSDARAARFVLYEQKFLELLEAGRTADALDCLRNHLTRLSPNPKLLHKLPLLCMCTTPQEVRDHAEWPGAGQASRTAVLEKLHRYIPSTHLLQENRLENLLCQNIEQQKRLHMFPYTRQSTISLLEDMEHCKERVPNKILHRLEGHSDEVWFVQFSHRGVYLASASKDTTVIIWKVEALLQGQCSSSDDVIFHKLQGHTKMISFLSWSPDDSRLLSCGSDHTIRLWNVESGECVRVFEKHKGLVNAVAWMPDGVTFISGAFDRGIYEWKADTGACTGSYPANAYVNDLTLSKDGQYLIATCSDKAIQIFDTTTREEIKSVTESASVTSLCLSPDGDSLLASTNSCETPDMQEPEIHVWSVKEMRVTQTLQGFKQSRFVVRGCFGGHNQMLVLCGSEDNLVYIWERSSGNLIAQLAGHDGTVNTVACSEANENLFASGSDDKSVIVSLSCFDSLLFVLVHALVLLRFVLTIPPTYVIALSTQIATLVVGCSGSGAINIMIVGWNG